MECGLCGAETKYVEKNNWKAHFCQNKECGAAGFVGEYGIKWNPGRAKTDKPKSYKPRTTSKPTNDEPSFSSEKKSMEVASNFTGQLIGQGMFANMDLREAIDKIYDTYVTFKNRISNK